MKKAISVLGSLLVATLMGTSAFAQFAPEAGKKIYSNFNRDTAHKYDAGGWSVVGPSTGFGEQDMAMPFTPEQDATVTKVNVAVSLMSGTDGVSVGIYEDGGAVPGPFLKRRTVDGLPAFGGCCAVVSAHFSPGVPVTAGTKYWVVVRTNTRTTDTYAVWHHNSAGVVGPFAYRRGGEWLVFPSGTPSAFSVLGF